jgi:hypothetical protein
MKSFIHISMLAVVVAAVGCSTSHKLPPQLAVAQKAWTQKCRAIDTQTEAQKREIVSMPGVFTVAEAEILKARLDSLAELKKQKAEIDARFQMLSQINLGKAEKLGLLGTGLGWSGLFAGVGAAALTVASPANAVWIAVLSGYAGGIAGMNTILENNGLSRQQLAQLAASAVREFNEVNIQINFGELTICAVTMTPSCDSGVWERKFAEQQALVSRLQGLLYGLDIPLLAAEQGR